MRNLRMATAREPRNRPNTYERLPQATLKISIANSSRHIHSSQDRHFGQSKSFRCTGENWDLYRDGFLNMLRLADGEAHLVQ